MHMMKIKLINKPYNRTMHDMEKMIWTKMHENITKKLNKLYNKTNAWYEKLVTN